MKIYRKIWVENYGDIPIDENGRSYEIHHIDGNRFNNDLLNLMCVSIDEHYAIHEKQGDFHACMAIVNRKKESIETRKQRLSELSKKQWSKDSYRKKMSELSKAAWKNNQERKRKTAELRSKLTQAQLKNGTHPFLQSWLKDHLAKLVKVCKIKVENGTHNFQSKESAEASRQRALNRNSVNYVCPHCNKEGKGAVMKRHHFDRCKLLALDNANGLMEKSNA